MASMAKSCGRSYSWWGASPYLHFYKLIAPAIAFEQGLFIFCTLWLYNIVVAMFLCLAKACTTSNGIPEAMAMVTAL